jgi:hypothetical protein
MAQFATWSCLFALLVAHVAAQEYVDPLSGLTQASPAASATAAATATTALPASSIFSNAISTTAGVAGVQGLLSGSSIAEDQAEEAESAAFLDGFIESYLSHVTLNPGEKTCLREDVAKIAQHSVAVIKMGMKMLGGLLHGAAGGQQTGVEVLNGMSAMGEVMSVVNRVQMIGNGCLKADTMAVLNVTFAHLKNVTYVQTRLASNGMEILTKVADAAPMIKAKNYYKVGQDSGALLRKVLLSSDSTAMQLHLPEGMTKDQIGPVIMDGVIQGFFEAGSTLTITSGYSSDVHVFVDLHRCIAKEAKYFSSAVNAMYLFVAEISTDIEQMKLKSQGIMTTQNTNQLAWLGQLSGLLANVPTLMTRCGLTQEQMAQLGLALKHVDEMNIAVGIPGPTGDQVTAGVEASAKVEQASEYFQDGNYLYFGEELGHAFRDLLLAVDPQLASRGTVATVASIPQPRKYSQLKRRRGTPEASQSLPLTSAFFVGAFASSALAGMVLLRVVKWNRRDSDRSADVEAAGENDMAVE